MDEKNYLTDSIFLQDNKTYYEEDGETKLVKNHNWHHILSEYGWEKLPKQWIKILNTYLDKPKKNSLYGTLDCGQDGDCLFHCISYVINSNEVCDAKTLRENISNSITQDRYESIITIYQIMQEADDFDEGWEPDKMTFELFKKTLHDGGNNYWGDFITLMLIKEYLNINIIILNSNEYTEEYYHYPLMYDYDNKLNTIILQYENKIHFKLIGHFQESKMNYFFNERNIPNEIIKLINHLR